MGKWLGLGSVGAACVLIGCAGSGGGGAGVTDPESLFSGQTGSPAATACDSDPQCMEAAESRVEADASLSVRSAVCAPAGCEAVFVGDAGCGPTPSGPFYDCALDHEEVQEAWREELAESCGDDGACGPPADPAPVVGDSAARDCLTADECENQVSDEAEAADGGAR